MELSDILNVAAVRVSGSITSKKRLFHELGEIGETVYGVRPADISRALVERETLGPTAVGKGIALPHARLPEVASVIGVFIRLDRPIDFDAVDRQPVDLVFALFAPASSSVDHLRALALVSRTLRDADVCSKLRANTDPVTLHTVLTEFPASEAA
ncbi:MAG: PTS sugar transporter subunit IIA [Pseudomonadota bacterium]